MLSLSKVCRIALRSEQLAKSLETIDTLALSFSRGSIESLYRNPFNL